MGAGVGGAAYALLVRGALTLDVGVGRSVRPLGPLEIEIKAPQEAVFDVIAQPYLSRTPRAMAHKLEVIERGTDMVLAAHHTALRRGLIATTLETVRFRRPDQIDFRLVRGPVPHVVEQFILRDQSGHTVLRYTGELGTDFWAVGRWWAGVVAAKWEAAVRTSFEGIRTEAERRAGAGRRGGSRG